MLIVSRAQWGAQPWRPKVEMYSVPMTERTETLMHYHGGPPAHSTGVAVPRDVEAIHLANGWAGVGYNFLVDQAGVAYEGRGWNLVGAHCPGHNRTGIGIYVAIGGAQQPTPAALATARALYDEACRQSGRQLRKTWHGANYPTECPGPNLIAWVRSGMPYPAGREDNDMDLKELAGWDVSELIGEPVGTVNFQTAFSRIYKATVKNQFDVDALAAALARRLTPTAGQDPTATIGPTP